MPESPTVNIAPQIFRRGKLLFVSFSVWPGTKVQTDDDLKIQGATRPDAEFFKPGVKILIPKKELKDFESCRSRYAANLDRESIPSPLPDAAGCRMIPTDRMAAAKALLVACDLEMEQLRGDFLERYPKIRDEQCRVFNEKHPEHLGALDSFYPSLEEVGKKFGFTYLFTEITDLQGLEDIIVEERENTRQKMVSYAEDLAAHFRKTALEAALAFRRGMERATHKVDERAVTKFKDFLERFQSANVMEDQALSDMLESMKEQVFNVASWKVGDGIDGLKDQLDQVIALAETEGAASEISDAFIENVDLDSGSINMTAPEPTDVDIT